MASPNTDRTGRAMSAVAPGISSEKTFSDLWERALTLRPKVVDRGGDSYEIVFPGIRNPGPGPDFRGAVLKHKGRTLGGDVELHLDPSGWRGHRHHDDPNYNGVVLQVVLRTGRGLPPAHSPPTAIATFPQCADGDDANRTAVGEADLERMGVERFIAMSSAYRLRMESGADADQVIYRGIMEAMGYARNRRPFLTLAGALPLSKFAGLRDEPENAARFAVFASLVVCGGLLHRADPGERAQIKRVTRRLGIRRRLRPEDWSMFRVRPVNSPMRRMRGVARIVSASRSDGLLSGMRSAFDRSGARGLVDAVSARPFIGEGLSRTVVANAVLPALHAWASLDRSGNSRLAIDAFRKMPPPPPDSVTRGVMRSLCGSTATGVPKNAAQHSGIHALARSSSWPGESGPA